jgi:predicted transcriptional regulator
MTLREYRWKLGWSMSELARRAGVDYQTVSRIEKKGVGRFHAVASIARALSEALGKEVTIQDLDGIRIID